MLFAATRSRHDATQRAGRRRYLQTEGEGFRIDADKVCAEEKYDGVWVLRTNTTLPMREVGSSAAECRIGR